jgi:hypothetical protein
MVGTDTVFNPTCKEIEEMIDRLFENVIDTVGNLNRVGYLTVKISPQLGIGNNPSNTGIMSAAINSSSTGTLNTTIGGGNNSNNGNNNNSNSNNSNSNRNNNI